MCIRYQIKQSSVKDILAHLNLCNKNFTPALNTRVELAGFAEKIFDKTVTFEAWQGNNLIGLVSSYFNDNKKISGFINHVSVCCQFQGQGISSKLLNMCIRFGIDGGFKEISLEVQEDNFIAVKLYEKLGFNRVGSNDELIIMKKYINEG